MVSGSVYICTWFSSTEPVYLLLVGAFNPFTFKVIIDLYDSIAAAAAKSLQSCPTLCDPIDGSPQGSLVPRVLQAKTLEWVAISFSNAGK